MDKDFVINSLLVHLNETKPTKVDVGVYVSGITNTNSNEVVEEYHQYFMDSELFENSAGYLGLSKFGRKVIDDNGNWYNYKKSLKFTNNWFYRNWRWIVGIILTSIAVCVGLITLLKTP